MLPKALLVVFVPLLASSTVAAASAHECALADYLPLMNYFYSCLAVSGVNISDFTPGNQVRACNFAECRQLIAHYADLDCTIQGMPQSLATKVCAAAPPLPPSSPTSAPAPINTKLTSAPVPTGPPGTKECTMDQIAFVVPDTTVCMKVSGINFAKPVPGDEVKSCTFPECRKMYSLYTELTCNYNGIYQALFAKTCDAAAPLVPLTKLPVTTLPATTNAPCAPGGVPTNLAIAAKCQLESNLTIDINVTSTADVKKLCSFASCTTALELYRGVKCLINGVSGAARAAMCDQAPANATTTANNDTTTSNECTWNSLPVGYDAVQAKCFAAANIASVPTTKASLRALCAFPDCASLFAMYKPLTCTLNGNPASAIAQTCTATTTTVPMTTVATPAPSTGSRLESTSMIVAFLLGLLVLAIVG
ncbi:Aste57867_12331 [Aphanomyces stellatus]|uniref:Aste57867_12331 protein n=1 Tax=Aphanomyces stellatus TaxID=120398 RepID=A0A485KVP2_9STRA|nr:hypothetical protein As57867_012285 [Aphanomyces stellatus]VFT89183.1 Aste57867_12331 [Aphanomyces stellatus]